MIFNLGGGAFETPTLNPNYPADASIVVIDGKTASATFAVEIATHGAPTEYTYQWYENGTAIAGATGSSYTKTVTTGGTHTLYCKVTNAAGEVLSRTATLTVTLHKVPVLNSSYPANVTQVEKSGGSATFKVQIATAGIPASYTYQWYVNGSAVSGATGSSYTKTGLTSAATYTVYCKVTNAAGTVQSRTATLTVQSSQPVYTYSGSHELIKEGTYNWKIKLKSGGTLRFSHLGNCTGTIDVFLVGGGGGGGTSGGGGGKTTTSTATIAVNTNYTIAVGGGGASGYLDATGGTGGTSTAFGKSAAGGTGGTHGTVGSIGGSGGSGGGGYGGGDVGGAGGSDGGNGTRFNLNSTGGSGQGTTTREFGSSSGTLYAGGGGGAGKPGGTGGSGGGGAGLHVDYYDKQGGSPGATNTGGGGGGYSWTTFRGGAGGSGIVVIRNKR